MSLKYEMVGKGYAVFAGQTLLGTVTKGHYRDFISEHWSAMTKNGNRVGEFTTRKAAAEALADV